MRFRRINAFQTDSMLCVSRIQHRDRVAISNANDAAVEGLAAGWPIYGLRRCSLTLRLAGTTDAEDRRKGNQPYEPRRAPRVDLILPGQFFKRD